MQRVPDVVTKNESVRTMTTPFGSFVAVAIFDTPVTTVVSTGQELLPVDAGIDIDVAFAVDNGTTEHPG